MLYFLVNFVGGVSVRAKSVTIDPPLAYAGQSRVNPYSFRIITEKDETLLMHHSKIESIVPTTASWKKLRNLGVVKADVA